MSTCQACRAHNSCPGSCESTFCPRSSDNLSCNRRAGALIGPGRGSPQPQVAPSILEHSQTTPPTCSPHESIQPLCGIRIPLGWILWTDYTRCLLFVAIHPTEIKAPSSKTSPGRRTDVGVGRIGCSDPWVAWRLSNSEAGPHALLRIGRKPAAMAQAVRSGPGRAPAVFDTGRF